jgi:peptidoglycan hydrolase-like protein with peptidoglycan-binding domain
LANYDKIKPYRQLRRTTPFMRGDDVHKVQHYLKLKKDGVFGPATASAVAAWKRRAGYPASHINPLIGVTGQQYLFGTRRLPVAFKIRAKSRAKAAKKAVAVRPARLKAMDLMVAWANSGVMESPSNSNKVPTLQALSRSLNLSSFYTNMGWPWCAFAVMLAALRHGSKTATYGLRRGKFNALYTPDILYHAARNNYGMKIVGASQAEPGDFVMINFPGGDPRVDHVGIVTKSPVNGWVQTVEANTSAVGSQDNGGAVLRKNRPLSQVSAFIRYE